MTWYGLGTFLGGIGALLVGVATFVRSRLAPGDPVRLEVRAYKAEVRSLRRELALADANLEDARRDLRKSREQEYSLKEALSEARTVIAALRKLVPGGDWWEKLGIDLSDKADN